LGEEGEPRFRRKEKSVASQRKGSSIATAEGKKRRKCPQLSQAELKEGKEKLAEKNYRKRKAWVRVALRKRDAKIESSLVAKKRERGMSIPW